MLAMDIGSNMNADKHKTLIIKRYFLPKSTKTINLAFTIIPKMIGSTIQILINKIPCSIAMMKSIFFLEYKDDILGNITDDAAVKIEKINLTILSEESKKPVSIGPDIYPKITLLSVTYKLIAICGKK